MSKEIDLWVCPHCDVLQGIETSIDNQGVIKCICLSCGINLKFEVVEFIDEELVRKSISYVSDLLPEEMLPRTRFSWVSNKTLGIIFDYSREDLYDNGIDPDEFEDNIENNLGINVTLFYEF